MARPKRARRKPESSSESGVQDRLDQLRRDGAAASNAPPERRDARQHTDRPRADWSHAPWKPSDAEAEDRLLAMHGFVAAVPPVQSSEQAPRVIEAQLEYRGQLLTFTLSNKTTLAEVARMFESWAADMRMVHEEAPA